MYRTGVRQVFYSGMLVAGLSMGAVSSPSPQGASEERDKALLGVLSSKQQQAIAAQKEAERQRPLYKSPGRLFAAMTRAADCAARLVEKEYSLGAVMVGGTFLHDILRGFLPDRYQCLKVMDGIWERCQVIAAQVKSEAEEITHADVRRELGKALPASPYKEKLMTFIGRHVHGRARCEQSTYGVEFGALFGFQVGVGSAKCQTPYGRRFMLRGALVGMQALSLGAGVFGKKSIISVPLRGSSFAVDRSFHGGLAVVAGPHVESVEIRDNELLGETLVDYSGKAWGIGAYGYVVGSTENLCRRTALKANFVPFFEHFGLSIPLD